VIPILRTLQTTQGTVVVYSCPDCKGQLYIKGDPPEGRYEQWAGEHRDCAATE
jgi:hypothetical protein